MNTQEFIGLGVVAVVIVLCYFIGKKWFANDVKDKMHNG